MVKENPGGDRKNALGGGEGREKSRLRRAGCRGKHRTIDGKSAVR